MQIFGYKEDLMLSIMADTGKMERIEDVKLYGRFIKEEIKNLEDALVAEYEKSKSLSQLGLGSK